MRRVMQESKYGVTCGSLLRSDNQSAINWTPAKPPPSACVKHISFGLHFIRNLSLNGRTTAKCVPTDHNDVDILTKPVGRPVLVKKIIVVGFREKNEKKC